MKGMITLTAVIFILAISIQLNAASIEIDDLNAIKSIKLPAIEVDLKDGAGKDKTALICNLCHSADYITMQPRFSPDTWSAVVHKMIVVFGAPVSEDDSRTIINYLSSNYGDAGTPTSSDTQMETKPDESGLTGEELFKRNCEVCHRGGGNIINKQKTLNKEVLKANGITTPEAIIKIMRNPGPGMRAFSEKDLSDDDARKIAEYILKTF